MYFMLFVHSGDDEFDDFPDTESPGEIILADHFQGDDIWLQLREFISFLISYLNFSRSCWGFKNNSPNLHKKTTNCRILVVVVRWHHRAMVLFCVFCYPIQGSTSEIMQDCEVIACPQNLYFLFRDHWVCVWKLIKLWWIYWLQAQGGGVGERRK